MDASSKEVRTDALPHEMMRERTLIILKPDTVILGHVGEILHRFEKAQLKIVALKMLLPTRELLDRHFPNTEKWMLGMAGKSLDEYMTSSRDVFLDFGTDDALLIGRALKERCYEFYLSGPVVAAVLEGVGAVAVVRKMVGGTLPCLAAVGTIRGDFAIGNAALANSVGSPTKNIIHASGDKEEAVKEILVWFSTEEIMNYARAGEKYVNLGGAKFGWQQSD